MGGMRVAASGDRTAGPNDGLGEALTDWSTEMHGSRALVGGAGGGSRWPARCARCTGGSGPRAEPRDAQGVGGVRQGALQGGGHSHWRVPELGSPARGSHRRRHRTRGDPPGAPRTRRGVAASRLLARALPRRLLRHARAAVLALHRLLVVGYKSQPVVGPESPSVVANYVAERDEAEAYRLTGAYYAKAYDRFHELSEQLGGGLRARR